jgi:hypothetical protein
MEAATVIDDELQETYLKLGTQYPDADVRDLLDALEAAQKIAQVNVVGPRLLVRQVLHNAPVGERAALEGALAGMRADAHDAGKDALRRAALTNGPE